MNYSESKIRYYIKKCIKDACVSEGREYNQSEWTVEWICIENKNGQLQFLPILKGKYERVQHKVRYRLKNNLEKHFGIVYGDTKILRTDFRQWEKDYPSFDPKFVQASFRFKEDPKKDAFSLHAYDNITIDNAGILYERLLKECYKESDKSITRDEARDILLKKESNWEVFKAFYKEVFSEEVGARYNISCSSGIERL